jgi:DNA-3-methyladenine glycosylase II
MIHSFDKNNFHQLCDTLSYKDTALQKIIQEHSYPPMWTRTPTFATLVHIILEQQVSLASAKAAFIKLQEKVGNITPEHVIALNDVELRACYFSRQKTQYVKHLAFAVLEKQLNIEELIALDDDIVCHQLKQIKGIGNWTADIFLMMALHRTDVFPAGDIALIKSMKEVKDLPPHTSKETVMNITEGWKPFRTIGAFLLWHAYIKKRNIIL